MSASLSSTQSQMGEGGTPDINSDELTRSSGQMASDSGSMELPVFTRAAGDISSPYGSLTKCSRVFWTSPIDFTCNIRLPHINISDIDLQRLNAVAQLLKCGDPVTVLDCCEVISNELLQDFTVNIFLEHSDILEALIHLTLNCLKSPELVELSTHTIRCIGKLIQKLTVQLHEQNDLSMLTCPDEIPEGKNGTWSVLEVCWAGLTTAAHCILQSDCDALLGEALALLRVNLALHSAFFPEASIEELSHLSLLLADVVNSEPPAYAYLQLLLFIKKFVTQRPMALRNSDILKGVIQNAILKPGIWCLNADLVQDFLLILKDLPEDNRFCKLVGGVSKMCQALSSSQQLLKLSDNRMDEQKMKEALVSLDFLPRPYVVRAGVETLCRAQGWQTTGALLMLLAHSNEDIQAAAYHHCHQVVLATVGVGQARDPVTYSPNHIAFLCDDKVIQEITCFGLENDNPKVQAAAEDILIHLIKCRYLVPTPLWSQISSCIAFLMPLLVSRTTSIKVLREALLAFLRPTNKNVDLFQCVRGNACFLFGRDEKVRIEAATQLLDILEKHPENFKKWPQKLSINTSPFAMSSLCVVQETFKFSNNTAEIFYSESSLRQIVGLLGPDCCDPTVRHSALCQLAVMLLEPRLMPAFLETNGVQACIEHLDQALSQDNVMVLSKSVKPIISILCLVAGNHLPSCQSLAQNETVLLNLVRAMFLYSSVDNDFRQHHSALMALLLFSDFLRHKPSSDPLERLVLPYQLVEGLMLPFHAGSYSRVSTHTPANHWHYLRALTDGHSDNLSLLFRCHLTLDMIGVIGKTAEAERAGHLNKEEIQHLLQFDAKESLTIAFHSMQAATGHAQVLAALPALESYLPCVQTQGLDWIETFSRFFTKPPATNDDAILLKAIVIIICEHGDLSWLPWHEIILKLDPWQPSTLHTFLPLLLKCCEHLEENVVAKTTIVLFKCLLTYETSRDNSILRSTLKCLGQLIRLHGVQISSRLMADVMAPLVDITGRFTTRYTSFVNLGIVENALSCLSVIQANNPKIFAHHFSVYSETCDIFNTLLKIIASNETTCKALALTIVAGLTAYQGMKNNTNDLENFIKKSISLVLDTNERILIRHQAVVLLSSVIDSSETVSNTEVFIKLLSESQWFEHLACLWEGLHLDENFILSLHMDPLIPKSPSEVVKQIVTPDYLAAHYSFLYNLSVASPLIMMDKIRDHGLFTQVLWSMTVCLEDKPQNLRPDICNFITQTSNLLAYCLITDEKDALTKELHNFPYLAPQLLNIMQLPEFPQVAPAVFWLMLTMQQSNHGALFVSAFQEGLFWSPLIAVLKLPEVDRIALFLTRSLALQAVTTHPKSTSNEANAGCVKVCEMLTVKLQREDTHQAAMAALAGLLAGWPSARRAALKLGLLDSIIVAISLCQTGLLTVRDLRQLAHTDKQIHPLVDEIIDSFELLVGLLLNDLKNKTTASQTSLAEEIFKLWPVCLVNSKMCLAAVKLLAVYTSGCENASTSLLLREHLVGGVKMKRCASNTSLYHYIVQLVTLELNKASSPTICLALRVLRQSCSSIECRATLTKTSVLQDIFVTSGFSCLVSTTQLAVLNFLESFSRHQEGQLAIAKIPEAIESLTVAATDLKGNEEINHLSVEVLRNICFCHANRIIVLTSSAILTCFLRLLSLASSKLVQLVATAIWSMAANQHRNKQALKVAGFQQALVRARLRCIEASSAVAVIDAALDNLVDS